MNKVYCIASKHNRETPTLLVTGHWNYGVNESTEVVELTTPYVSCSTGRIDDSSSCTSELNMGTSKGYNHNFRANLAPVLALRQCMDVDQINKLRERSGLGEIYR